MAGSSAIERRSRLTAAGMSPRASARWPAEESLIAARSPIPLASSTDPELDPIAIGLFEVVAEDLLELELTAALAG